jgi:hypothetical protein
MRYKATETDIENAKAVASQLRAGLKALAEAERLMQTANARLEQLALANLADFNTLRPDDDKALDAFAIQRARFVVLREWVGAAEPLRDAVRELQASLWRARDVVQEIGQPRSVEESALVACDWTELLRRIPDIDLPNQMKTVRNTGNQVVRDLDQLLSCRVGLLLGDDERRDGVLRISGRGVVRQLAANERSAGVAFE